MNPDIQQGLELADLPGTGTAYGIADVDTCTKLLQACCRVYYVNMGARRAAEHFASACSY